MKLVFRSFCVLIWMIPTAFGEPTTQPEDLQGILKQIRKDKKVPGLAAAAVRSEGVTASAAEGLRQAGSKNRVTLEDCWHLGSCTKSMTATLCAKLVEEGKLSWGRTIAEAFPGLVESIHPDWHKVTLEQLLCHRSGLPEDRAPDMRIWPKIRALKGALPAQREKMMGIVLARPAAAEAGTTFAYSNFGFAIAGAMCEAATGSSYEDLLREKLFTPLGMTTAGFGAPGMDDKDGQPWGHDGAAGGYVPVKPGALSDNPAVIGPAGLVHCSIGDWAKYAQMHLAGARGTSEFLKKESFEKLHHDVQGQKYAFGWAIRSEDRATEPILSHSGSNGRWFASIVIEPEKNLAIVVATNAADPAAQEACRNVVRGVEKIYSTAEKP